MTTPTRGLAEELDDLVRRTPGVGALYRSEGLLGQAVVAAREALSAEGEAEPYVRVAERNGRTAVTVTIGVETGSAVETCRGVHDAIAERLRDRGDSDLVITITVAHVAA